MDRAPLYRLLVGLCVAACCARIAADEGKRDDNQLRCHADGTRVTVSSTANPSWRAVIDRRHGGVITELRIPADGENIVSRDGDRFEGLCNLVFVDFKETGKESGYVAKGTYSYHGAVNRLAVTSETADRVVVEVEGVAGNQVKPRRDVAKFRQQYTFLPDKCICTGELDWQFDDAVPDSRPELIQPSCLFAPGAVAGEMRVWDKDTGPLELSQTDSKGRNFPPEIDYPLTVEVPLKNGNALRIRSLNFPDDFARARFYWNEYPRQIESRRGFAFKAWQGWPGNGDVKFSNTEPIRYSYELAVTRQLPAGSPLVKQLTWAPPATIIRRAAGSDNWPVTTGDDGSLYAAYGDGNGFEPFVEKKLSLGLARIAGGPRDFAGINLRSPDAEQEGHGTAGKKASGLLMVDGKLYMWVRNAENSILARSTDRGSTWSWADWKWTKGFGCPTFLNFGANYAGARDAFVYIYSPDADTAYEPSNRMVLARAPQERLMDRDTYEFFVRCDAQGAPVWSHDESERGSVFTHQGNCGRSGITFNSGLKRYLWCQTLAESTDLRGPRYQGGFGIYDAPEPWGPWTTVYFTQDWDVGPGETSVFPTKWMSADGRTLYLVFSGDDSFSVRQAHLETN